MCELPAYSDQEAAIILLNLPFVYRASILPSPRHRNPCNRWVRGYTDVLIPEISSSDVEQAIEISEPRRRGANKATLVSHRGRLFRPTTSLATGRTYGPKEFEVELSKRGHQIADLPVSASDRIDFDHRLFPTEWIRWNVAYLDPEFSGPLSWPMFAVWAKAEGWPAPVTRQSSEEHMRAWAQSHYTEAFVIIDNVLHVECPEPVWCVKSYGLPKPRVVLEQFPTLQSADDYFRLDQSERARKFAERIGGSGRRSRQMGRTMLCQPTAVERVDPFHIARSALRPLCRLGIPNRLQHCVDCLSEDFLKIFDKIESDGLELRLCDVPAMLEALEAVFEIAVETGWYDDNRGDWRHLQDVVRRWKFEKEIGLDMAVFDEFSPEDLGALMGCEFDEG